MGLGNNSAVTYLSITNGKVARRVQQPTESSKQRTTSEGKVVHEEIFDHISGHLTDITLTEHDEYGKYLNLKLHDSDEKRDYILQFGFESGYSSAFMKIAPNIDPLKELTIIPKMSIENDKKKATLFLKQKGVASVLKHYFTKDDPKGMPPPVSVNYKGKEQWDYYKQTEFLFAKLNEMLISKLNKNFGGSTSTTNTTTNSAADDSNHINEKPEGIGPEDDLPF